MALLTKQLPEPLFLRYKDVIWGYKETLVSCKSNHTLQIILRILLGEDPDRE